MAPTAAALSEVPSLEFFGGGKFGVPIHVSMVFVRLPESLRGRGQKRDGGGKGNHGVRQGSRLR